MGYQLMLRKIRKTKRMTQNELAKAIGSTDRSLAHGNAAKRISLLKTRSAFVLFSAAPERPLRMGWQKQQRILHRQQSSRP